MQEMLIATPQDLSALARRVLVDVERPRAERAGAAVLALHGELGAGKTAFVQALARALDIVTHVPSSTFVIMRRYLVPAHERFTTLVHIDAYRVESLDEMKVIGFADVLSDPYSLVCIEWAERVADLLPGGALHLRFAYAGEGGDEDMRTVAYGYEHKKKENETGKNNQA